MPRPYQDVLLALLSQLQAACAELGIDLAYVDRLAWDAVKFGRFHDSTHDAVVAIDAKGLPLLKEALSSLPNRIFERDDLFEVNGAFRFVACDSLYIDPLLPIYTHPGIFVRVYALEFEDGITSYCFGGKNLHLGREILFPSQIGQFENDDCPLPRDINAFFSLIQGEEWRTKNYEGSISRDHLEVICIPDMPFQDYLDIPGAVELINDPGYQPSKRRDAFNKNIRKSEKYSKRMKRFEESRTMTSERFWVWEKLYPKKGHLKALHDAGQWEQLEEELSFYLADVERFAKSGLGFYVDHDLFDWSKPLLEKRMGTEQFEKYESSIHPAHLKDMDQYLRENGICHPLLS